MFPGFRHACAVGLAAALAIVGCGQTTTGAQGISCRVNSDCNSGLTCAGLYEAEGGSDGGCGSVGSVCLQSCRTSADCTEAGYVCSTPCGGTPVCLPYEVTDAATDALPEAATEATTDAAVDVASQ